MELEVIVEAPLSQVFYLAPLRWLITTHNSVNNSGVISKFKYGT